MQRVEKIQGNASTNDHKIPPSTWTRPLTFRMLSLSSHWNGSTISKPIKII
jgi:hypothetical protein